MTESSDALPDGTHFFTLCLADRHGTVLVDHIDRLRAAYAVTLREMPVTVHAMVVLPNHLHAIWTEPGLPRFPERWRRIKTRFAQALGGGGLPAGQLWQDRFYDHAIRRPEDFDKAMDYCRMNPVQHGLVAAPDDWAYSSFSRRPN